MRSEYMARTDAAYNRAQSIAKKYGARVSPQEENGLFYIIAGDGNADIFREINSEFGQWTDITPLSRVECPREFKEYRGSW